MDSVAQEGNNDLINRGEILSYIDKVINQGTGKHKSLKFIRKYAEMMPSAQPDTDEWCTDCKEYDNERHCCPRWNRVIRETLKDAQPDYTEMKQEFLRMASYIDVLLECSDEQKETLMRFISRLAEYMPWTERD